MCAEGGVIRWNLHASDLLFRLWKGYRIDSFCSGMSGEAVASDAAGQQQGQALQGPHTAPPRNRNKFAGLHRPSAPTHPPADEAVSIEGPLVGESLAAFQSKGSTGEGAMAAPEAPERGAGTAAAGGSCSVVVPAPPLTARQLARRERVKAKRRKQKGRGAAADAEDEGVHRAL